MAIKIIHISTSNKRRDKCNPLTMSRIPHNPTGKPVYKRNKKAQEEWVEIVRSIEYKKQQEAKYQNE